jgi:exonuclease SbcC
MRPIRLEIKNVTAFRAEQTIEFDGLDLFAISGQTGAGKSTILDAMTYALFGRIERIGKQGIQQLISQGQPSMAVMLEFAIDGSRYRITRRTNAKGTTAVQFELAEGDEWIQAGEGSDKVSGANELIKRAIGLDYDAFTRTVLLPQNRFAEFLVGDAKERRSILTDLLGLELFERLGKRAGDIKREAEVEARARTTLLETEYAGITPDAVAEAERIAKDAKHRDDALADAEAKVREVADRWADSARTISDLRTCERDLRDAAGVAASVASTLEQHAARALEVEDAAASLAESVAAAEKLHAKAAAAREKAETTWGRAVDLAGVRSKAEALLDARHELADTEIELAEATAAVPALDKAAAASEQALAVAVADATAAADAQDAVDEALEAARLADHVAAVRAGVHVGDDCPVCGTTVAALPKAAKAPTIAKAQQALDRAKDDVRVATEAATAATRARDKGAAAVVTARADVERCSKVVAKVAKETRTLEAAVATALGGKLPKDPVATIDERLERLEELAAEEDDARAAAEDARRASRDVERARAELAAAFAQERGRLGTIAVAGLLDRATASAGLELVAPEPLSGDEDVAQLRDAATGVATALEQTATTLAATADERAEGERAIVVEAAGHLDGLVDATEATTVAEALALASRARTAATQDAARFEDRANATRDKLANAEALVEQIGEHRHRADVFDALAKELRQDRLIAFLQVEALQLLAAAGSERLSALTSGRYRLEYEDDEFSVIDTWNGEERRSARTLSGGETFLASLALALALSEQVRALSVTEKARLDSLFLDEGFGTLDAESLEVVVEAIEQLGGDGRMVGVITHVQELAIRLPSRIEVEKSPRGSTVRVIREGEPVVAPA